MRFDLARKIADAVLYEGYVLYPYRASSAKNRFRWQFGIVAPHEWSVNGGCEPWEVQTECLVEPLGGAPAVDIKVRFLQVEARWPEDCEGRALPDLELDGKRVVPWEEGIEREADLHMRLENGSQAAVPLEMRGARSSEEVAGGRIVRERWPVSAVVRASVETADTLFKLRVRIENVTAWCESQDRSAAVRRSLVNTHLLLGARGGAFVSLMDSAAASSCTNLHTWPVLVGRKGERDMMLSAPIILYDFPEVAPESNNDFFDGTEIDELLTLRVMTLTDEEKREAFGTDNRAREIVERSDSIPREVFEKLHGAVRSMKSAAAPQQPPAGPGTAEVARGSRVLLRPRRRADSMDLFLKGRMAKVESVERDLEGNIYVAVVVEGDPAGDLHDWYGRYFYFYPDELEIVREKEK